VNGSFGIGSALGTAGRIWVRNLPAFGLFAIACYLPAIAFYVALQYTPLDEVVGKVWLRLYELHPQLYQLAGGGFLLFALGSAAVVRRTVTTLHGERASIGASLGHALRRAPAIAGVAVIGYVAVQGTTAVITSVALADDRVGFPTTIPAIIAQQLLELVLHLAFVLAIPVVVSERIGAGAAIARGWRLGRGVRWRLGVLLLVIVVVSMLLHALLRVVLIPSDVGMGAMRERMYLLTYAMLGLSLVLMTFRATVFGVAYAQLRADVDGPTAGELERVFG